MNHFRLTLSMPCYGRRKGTIRAIECIANQTMNSWEALVTGDGCPIMQDFVTSNYFADIVKDCESRGNSLVIKNNRFHNGGHGFHITNENIEKAKGRYFIFYANDDIILPNHFSNYLNSIECTDYDFMYFDSWVNPNNCKRVSRLNYGMIGHSELIIKTSFLKQMPKHNEHYGHDWELISAMAKHGKFAKSISQQTTYHVMSLPNNREKDI
jgi:hypothetical protein